MNIESHYLPPGLTLALAILLTSHAALAAESTMARGNLSVEGPDKDLTITLTHAYYYSGKDRSDETRTVRSIVFTADDQRAAIDACDDTSCAMLSSSDGLQIELTGTGMANWWAHVSPIQYSGTAASDALKLSVDNADRVAGTFKIGGSGAQATVEFDASLVRDFSKPE